MVGIDCCFVGIYNDFNITINALDRPSPRTISDKGRVPIFVVSLVSI